MGVLREIFGPSKDEIWAKLSRELGGQYEPGGFLDGSRVTVEHGQWQITLDIYNVHNTKSATPVTRIRAPYVNADGFAFNIFTRSALSWLLTSFGGQDFKTGDPAFDDRFVVQGTSGEAAIRLLSNENIRALIEAQPDVHFEVKNDDGWFGAIFPAGVDELYFQTLGVIKDEQQLKGIFDLFSLVLDELCRMGSAYESDPGVKLG